MFFSSVQFSTCIKFVSNYVNKLFAHKATKPLDSNGKPSMILVFILNPFAFINGQRGEKRLKRKIQAQRQKKTLPKRVDIIYALSTASSICKYGKTKINNEREKTREKSYTIWINIESYSSRALLMMLLLLYQAEAHILSILTDISTLYSLWKSNIIPFYLLIAVVIAISFHHLMDEHQWVYSACTRTFVLLLLKFQCIFFVFVCVCVCAWSGFECCFCCWLII